MCCPRRLARDEMEEMEEMVIVVLRRGPERQRAIVRTARRPDRTWGFLCDSRYERMQLRTYEAQPSTIQRRPSPPFPIGLAVGGATTAERLQLPQAHQPWTPNEGDLIGA